MSNEEAAWNERYASGSHVNSEPDPLLIKAYNDYILPLLPAKGTALDIAGGVGRNAIWLAARGWRVTLVDVSDAGLAIATERAKDLPITFVQQDLTLGIPPGSFDLILNFFYLERSLYGRIVSALAPGGLLIFKTYTRLHPALSGGKGPTHPMHLLAPGELLHEFEGLDVLYYRETVRDKGVAEVIARKPTESLR